MGRFGSGHKRAVGVLVIVVLASVAVGLVANYGIGRAQEAACEREIRQIQAGLETYLEYYNLTTVPSTEPFGTNDMTRPVPLWGARYMPAAPMPFWASFAPAPRTQYYYAWDQHGHIVAVYADGHHSAAPQGCLDYQSS